MLTEGDRRLSGLQEDFEDFIVVWWTVLLSQLYPIFHLCAYEKFLKTLPVTVCVGFYAYYDHAVLCAEFSVEHC